MPFSFHIALRVNAYGERYRHDNELVPDRILAVSKDGAAAIAVVRDSGSLWSKIPGVVLGVTDCGKMELIFVDSLCFSNYRGIIATDDDNMEQVKDAVLGMKLEAIEGLYRVLADRFQVVEPQPEKVEVGNVS